MGDVNQKTDQENEPVETMEGATATAVADDPGRQSIDLLKETKELADITISSNIENSDSRVSNKANSEGERPTGGEETVEPELPVEMRKRKKAEAPAANIEMVYENVGMDKIISSEAPLEPLPDPPQEIANQSNMNTGRMNKIRDQSSSIFPVGIMGCKEDVCANPISPRRFLDAREAANDAIGHIDSIPRKMANSKSDHGRNPLTGTGVDSSDELKSVSSKKKVDGNPVLGLGYDKKMSSSSTRIPPGGFSHGLW